MYTVFDVGDRISARLHTSGSEGGVSFRKKISARLTVARWRVSASDAAGTPSQTRRRLAEGHEEHACAGDPHGRNEIEAHAHVERQAGAARAAVRLYGGKSTRVPLHGAVRDSA